MKKLPGALFVVDTIKENIAIKEARKLGIPTIALVDTNGDPTTVDHVIPGNDDAIRSVSLFSRLVAESCMEGAKDFQDRVQEKGEGKNEDKVEQVHVSKFEGDVDLKGLDESDLDEIELKEELAKVEGEKTEGDKAAADKAEAAAGGKTEGATETTAETVATPEAKKE